MAAITSSIEPAGKTRIKESAYDSRTQSNSDPPPAILRHGAGRHRCALQYHVDVCSCEHRDDRRHLPDDPLVAGKNGAQVEENSVRYCRLALFARSPYARASLLVRSDPAGFHRHSRLPDGV